MPTISIEQLTDPRPGELDSLTDLWEASVRATHHFLTPEDLSFFRNIVRREALPTTELHVIRAADGSFAAFMGLDGDMLEMLFVAPRMRGRGLGRKLVEYAVAKRNVRRVDVNEQNEQAAGFYARMGFGIVGRDAFDPSGHPYPILHLELRP